MKIPIKYWQMGNEISNTNIAWELYPQQNKSSYTAGKKLEYEINM